MQGFKSFNRRVSIPFLAGVNAIAGPNGSGKCLRGDSLVQLSNGQRKRIKDIVNNALERSQRVEEIDDGFVTKDNPEDVEILSMDAHTLLIRPKKVLAFVKRKSPRFLLRIKTRSGKEVEATAYHPLFTFRNGELVSLKADELKTGLKIATPRLLDTNGEIKKLDFATMFSSEDGLYIPYSRELDNLIRSAVAEFGGIKSLSEECDVPYTVIKSVFDKQSINIYYLTKILGKTGKEFIIKNLKSKTHSKTLAVPQNLTEELARFLGYIISDGTSLSSTSQVRFVNEDQILINDFSNVSNSEFGLSPSNENYKPTATDSIVYSRPLQTFLATIFGIKRGYKSAVVEVPEQIFTEPSNIKSHFLAGLIEGDGYVHTGERGKKHQCYMEYSTASKNLAGQVSTLFLQLGIVSLVKEKKKHATNTLQKKDKIYYSVMVYGVKNLRRLAELIPLKSRKLEELKKIVGPDIRHGDNLDVIPGCCQLVKELVKEVGIKLKKARKHSPKLAAYYENRCDATRHGLMEVVEFVMENYKISRHAEQIIKKILLLSSSDIFWDEITSIEKLKSDEEWVYDLSIDDTHNFIANNFVVHNSNVLDAVAFVLGRTSAKSLRADRLHELIYHGSGGKHPADFTSVTLTFDNSKKTFPVEGDELSINRKVNRKGVTVYKMNDRTVTRDKILQTLNIARIHPDGHNIILQGDVTEIIEMNPVERREIIDEISGIAEYNDKKEKSQKDMDAVDQKLKEAEIIITQRYDIFKKLEDERNAAIKYQNLQQQLKVLKGSLANKKSQTYQEQLAKFDEALSGKTELREKVDKELEEVENNLEGKEKSIREVADKLIDLSKRVEVEKEVSQIRSQLMIKKDKIDSNTREVQRLNDLIEKLHAFESKKAELSGEMPRAVRSILALKLRGVNGSISNLVSVPEKYQIAIEVAAGSHMNDIVVDDDDVASYCIEYLRRERIGRATFLPLNKIKPILFRENELLGKNGVVGVASKLIKYDTKFMSAVEFVFGNTLIVDKLDSARAIGVGRARMVSLDGDLMERSGAMIGGHYIRSHAKFVEAATKQDIDSYIDLRRRLQEEAGLLAEDVTELEKKLKKMAVSDESREFINLETLRIGSEQEIDKLRDKRKKLNERKLNLEIEINRANIDKARLETELNAAKTELEQYGQMTFVDEKIHTLENFIVKNEKEIAVIGLVNLKSIDEFEKFKNEFEGYKEKYEKILEEKKAVVEMIMKIEEKRKEVFFGMLNEIRKEFDTIFVKMLNGNASLELEDPTNIESGLLIKASPRGKTLLNIDSMSGGEKSLTALAFIFSIQSHRPSPFYVLDEIDAALDKANSKIVADMIKEFSKNAQFIIITHNDTTIKAADQVYGVSMSDGESKIMALELPKQ